MNNNVMKSKLAVLGGPKAVTGKSNPKWNKLDDSVRKAILAHIEKRECSISLNKGPIADFEAAFARAIGTKYALAMNSGTATLHSAYFAVGVGPGCEVIVPTYTWHATITPIIHCAATPVFCDIDPRTLTADPADIERKITGKTKAICVVHVWGNVADMDRIGAIARKHKLALIEDCSHAHGAEWKGRKVGSIGDVGCFSMQGVKPVSGGEAGVATMNDVDLYDRMVLLGHFGHRKLGRNKAILSVGDMSLGTKYRPHTWAIAMASQDLKKLPLLNRKRTANYEFMNRMLKNCPGIELVEPLPGARRGGYLEFKFKLSREVLKIASRERIVEAILAEGAPVHADRYSSFNYTYGLLHTAPLFTTFDRRALGGCFYDPTLTPVEEKKYRQIVSLPVAEDMAQRLISTTAFIDDDRQWIKQVCRAIIKVMNQAQALTK